MIMNTVDVVMWYGEHAERTELNDMIGMLEARNYIVLAATDITTTMSAVVFKGARAVVTYDIDVVPYAALSSVLKNNPETQSIFLASIYSEDDQPDVTGNVEYMAPDIEYRAPMGSKKQELVDDIDHHLKKIPQRGNFATEIEKRLKKIKW